MSRAVPFTYPYPRPAVTCDVVAFTMRAGDLAVLLVKRKEAPFKGQWALPGGYVDEKETLQRAAARELAEETGVTGVKLEQLGAYGDPGRDPRGHTITVAWLTYLVAEAKLTPGSDAGAVDWLPLRSLAVEPGASKKKTPLAFDHARLVRHAYRRLYEYLDNPLRPRAFELLPPRFTIAEVHHFYEVVVGRKLSPRAFKKRLFDLQLVVPSAAKLPRRREFSERGLGEAEVGERQPSPKTQLYRWNR
jgi:8-oxo-dGTP diphosphatase